MKTRERDLPAFPVNDGNYQILMENVHIDDAIESNTVRQCYGLTKLEYTAIKLANFNGGEGDSDSAGVAVSEANALWDALESNQEG